MLVLEKGMEPHATINIKQYNTGLNTLTNVRFPVLSVSIPWLFPVTHWLLLRTQILLPLQFPYSLAVIKVSMWEGERAEQLIIAPGQT